MADLFSHTEQFPNKTKAPTRKRGKYHDRKGRFTDKTTAEISQLEKECEINKRNAAYWKRQAKRLSEDYNSEHLKAIELENKLKSYESRN